MAFKKHNWMSLSREEKIISILIQEGDGKRLDFFRGNSKKDFPKITGIIKSKYGIDLTPAKNKENEEDLKKTIQEEKDFLDKEFRSVL